MHIGHGSRTPKDIFGDKTGMTAAKKVDDPSLFGAIRQDVGRL
jgi:hypothetical protein